MKTETEVKPISGYVMVFVEIVLLVSFIVGITQTENPVFLILLGIFIVFLKGFFFINPNGSRVLVLFGAYKGTVKENGFYWANPFLARQSISLRARNFDSKPVKVNDKLGNPIMIGVILVWQVKNTFKAAFEVDDYANFVNIQSDAAVRNLAGSYPYDNMDDDNKEITLRSGLHEVNHALEDQLRERLEIAGINVIEARISYLAYASEIAGAMLRRQQATAIVAARQKIVEGAVGMVEMALDELSKKEIIDLDEEKKAAMVSNLMVVLTSDKDASPVINTGTLHQ
ncbi:SPFH domain-containing protein [Flexithrix dorotheae]|uniref:SPFH domain-containing protein n=1 Tax=Flexithrix dorotheae TaxID=70993 RepID=UPI00036960CB|nr:SPFH domain-containing protein [Flexithrix dorotheae]